MSKPETEAEKCIEALVDVVMEKEEANEAVTHLTQFVHRTRQQSFMRNFVVPLLKAWAGQEEARYFDQRNEATVRLAKELVAAKSEDPFLPFI